MVNRGRGLHPLTICSEASRLDNKQGDATVKWPRQTQGNNGDMFGLEIAGAALALLAAILLGVVVRQRRALTRAEQDAASLADAVRSRAAAADRAMLATLIGAVNAPVVLHAERITAANPAFYALLGLSAESVVGRRLSEFVSADYASLVETHIARRLGGQECADLTEVEIADEHGQVTRLELKGTTVQLAGGRAVLLSAVEMPPVATGHDGPPRKTRAQMTLESLGDGLVTTDQQGRIDFLNSAAEEFIGQSSAQVHGRQLTDVVSFVDERDRRPLPDPVRQCLAKGAQTSLGRRALLVAKAAGVERSVGLSATPILGPDGEMSGVAIVLHDVTELTGLARQMSYQASHDALTGLVNRREFERRLAEAIESSREGQTAHMMCYLDLDNFKDVNDTCGHLAGDNMLREASALLKEAVRDSDTVGRLGGDEFGMLLVGCPLDKARQIAEDVCRAVADYRFVWKDSIFRIGVSIGLVEIGRDSGGPEDVMSAADSACYVAKRRNGNHVQVYSLKDEAEARHSGEIHWLQRLQVALRDGHFELYVQPIVSAGAAEGGPGLEAFLRLRDGDRTALPMEFMQAAERYRLMPLVDRWVVQTALAALGSGAINLPRGKSLAINLSGQTLGDAGFLEFVVDALDHSGVPPQQICFDMTETAVIGNLELARRFVGVVHGMGCQFALDDFGNDLGAFTHLKSLAMDFIKIDGSYLRDLSHDAVNQAMVAAIVRLARTLGFRLIAEQVEDLASLEAARGLGVDFAQGYAIGRPEPLRRAA